MMQRWQYQIKAEGQPPIILAFGWFVQASEPVRARPQHPEQATAQPAAEHAALVPSYGWNVAQPDVIRSPTPLAAEGALVLAQPPTIPAFDWFYQQADVVRPLHQTQPGWFVLVREPIEVLVDIDWLVAQPDVVRSEHQVREGGAVLGQEPIVPAFDWWAQETDVTRLAHQVRPGLSVLGEPPTIPAFDWYRQEEDVVLSLHQVRPGWLSLVEFGIPIPPEVIDLDWFVQEPDVRAAPYQVRPGLFVLGEPTAIPAFDWLVPPADIIRLPVPVEPGLISLVQLPPVPVPAFDWYRQVEFPVWPKPAALYTSIEVPPPPEVFLDSWWQQYPERPLPPPLRPYFYPTQEFRVEVPLEVFLQWFQIQENPVSPPQWLLGDIFRPLVVVAAPVAGPAYTIRECLVLWELLLNRLLPDPSDFVKPSDDPPDPSGWVRTDGDELWNLT